MKNRLMKNETYMMAPLTVLVIQVIPSFFLNCGVCLTCLVLFRSFLLSFLTTIVFFYCYEITGNKKKN